MAATQAPSRKRKARATGGIRYPELIDFEDETEYHDRVLIVDDQKFYVVSEILSTWSMYFRNLFGDKLSKEQKPEVTLDDVDPDTFREFLVVLYGSRPAGNIGDPTAQIELAVRFEAPKVIEFVIHNITPEKFVRSVVDILKTDCKNNRDDVKEMIVKYFTNYPPADDFEIIKSAVEYKLDSIVAALGKRVCSSIHPCQHSRCIDVIDFAFHHDIPTMKEAILEELSEWNNEALNNQNHYYGTAKKVNRPFIPEERILPLLECAFKHDITILKALLRNRIFYFVKTTDFKFNEYKDTKRLRHDVTVNIFLEEHRSEIFNLPKDIMEFVITSTISPD